jgi:hypothetical protein
MELCMPFVLADEVSPLFLLFLAPFLSLSFFLMILLLLGRDSSYKNFAYVEDHLMGRIKVGGKEWKRDVWSLWSAWWNGMFSIQCECDITKRDVVEARKSKFNERMNQPR